MFAKLKDFLQNGDKFAINYNEKVSTIWTWICRRRVSRIYQKMEILKTIRNEKTTRQHSKSSLWILPKSKIVIRTIYNSGMQKSHFKSSVLQLENLGTNQQRKKRCLLIALSLKTLEWLISSLFTNVIKRIISTWWNWFALPVFFIRRLFLDLL